MGAHVVRQGARFRGGLAAGSAGVGAVARMGAHGMPCGVRKRALLLPIAVPESGNVALSLPISLSLPPSLSLAVSRPRALSLALSRALSLQQLAGAVSSRSSGWVSGFWFRVYMCCVGFWVPGLYVLAITCTNSLNLDLYASV